MHSESLDLLSGVFADSGSSNTVQDARQASTSDQLDGHLATATPCPKWNRLNASSGEAGAGMIGRTPVLALDLGLMPQPAEPVLEAILE